MNMTLLTYRIENQIISRLFCSNKRERRLYKIGCIVVNKKKNFYKRCLSHGMGWVILKKFCIPWDGIAFKNFSSHGMGWYGIVPSHAEPCHSTMFVYAYIT